MKNRKTLLIIGAVAAVLLTLGLVVYVRWVVDFVTNWSDDVNKNALHMLGMTIPLALVALLEGFVIREIWHFVKLRQEDQQAEEIDLFEGKKLSSKARIRQEVRRQIRETYILWGVFIGVPLLANVLLINGVSGGYVLSGQGGLTRYATVATMLRSSDPAIERVGVDESVGLTEKSLGRYLSRIIAGRGPNAELAAWAASIRGDEEAVVPLRWLFLKGDADQRATAVISLALLGDLRGSQLTLAALKRGEDPALELVISLGLSTYEPSELYLEKVAADPQRPDILRAAAMWAIGQIEMERYGTAYNEQAHAGIQHGDMVQPERRCYAPMIEALEGDSLVLRCAAIQALGYSGPIEAAEPLMKVFEDSEHMDKCQSLIIVVHEATKVEFVKFGLLRSQIIDSLAKIGNRSIVNWLERQGDDRKNADEVILKARDLARQIRQLR